MSNPNDEKIPTTDASEGRIVIVVATDEALVNEYAAKEGLTSLQVVHCTTMAQAEDSKTRQFDGNDRVEIVNLLHAE